MNAHGRYHRLFSIFGVAVYVHWSLWLATALILFYAGVDHRQAMYHLWAYLVLIVMHELGHLVAARIAGLKVIALRVSAMGGSCEIEVPKSTGSAFWIYSAGLLVQAAIFAAAVAYLSFGPPAHTTLARAVLNTFIFINALLFVINVIPHKPKQGLANDGHVLWSLIQHARDAAPFPFPTSPSASRLLPPGTSVLQFKELVPDGFQTGVEILNDDTTPMDFVIHVLMTYLGASKQEAYELMLAIHTKGGALIRRAPEEAGRIASSIMDEAASRGFKLTCRAVDARAKPDVAAG